MLWILVVALTVGALFIGKQEIDKIHSNGSLAIRALCSQRDNYDRSIKSTTEFLKKHPKGIPGISRATFERSLRLTKNARAALADINC